MADYKQILLPSGRGARVRTLELDARLKVTESAATAIGAEGTVMDLRVREGKEAVATFVAAVTDTAGLTSKTVTAAKWTKLTPLAFEDGAAKKYFTAKDMAALVAVFHKIHDVSDKEVDDILGEALDVTED